MTDEQNARLNEAREQAGALVLAGRINALAGLRDDLRIEAWAAGRRGERDYRAALVEEAAIIQDSIEFLKAEYAAAHGEAVAHG